MNLNTGPDLEPDDLGINGQIILTLLEDYGKRIYQQLKAENILIRQIKAWEDEYNEAMSKLILSGFNQSEAREIAWPEITAKFGM